MKETGYHATQQANMNSLNIQWCATRGKEIDTQKRCVTSFNHPKNDLAEKKSN